MGNRLGLAAAALAVLMPWVACGARFVPLGYLPGAPDSDFSHAVDVSADGTVVIGSSGDAKAYRWTQATGMTYLGNGPGGLPTSIATAISGDGQTIVGSYGSGPFKWTQAGGVQAIALRRAFARGAQRRSTHPPSE